MIAHFRLFHGAAAFEAGDVLRAPRRTRLIEPWLIVNPLSIVRSGWHELTRRPASQVPALDALRAFAIFLVVGAHSGGSQWPLAKAPDIALAHNPVFNFGLCANAMSGALASGHRLPA